MKYFIITIDTEGDNLWAWKLGDPVRTENTRYLQRFQDLCNRFGFKPVWLTNYEMICDDAYIDFIKHVEATNTGELGLHLHAWNNPPIVELPDTYGGQAYLIEYPEEVMRSKFELLNNLVVVRTGIQPVTHRAGRWAMDDRYFRILKDYGYKVDCSVTPHKNWSTSPGQSVPQGPDYSGSPEEPYWIDDEKTLLEVPVTVRLSHKFYMPNHFSLKGLARAGYRMVKGDEIWLRPNGANDHQLMSLMRQISQSDSDYLMFMLHSSEFMPGGSPTFKTEESIQNLYKTLTKLFKYVSKKYQGITLRNYYEIKKQGEAIAR